MSKKFFILVLFTLLTILVLISVHLYTKKINNIAVTYEANAQGRFRNTKEIFEEVFDNFGNLTHYKYKPQFENYNMDEKEYNIDYIIDNNNRITKVSDNYGSYIKISYDNENKFSEISGSSLFENSTIVNYTHKFNYVGNITLINSSVMYNNDSAHPVNNTYKVSPLEINSEQCILFETYTDENQLIEEIVCKKSNKTINYSNIFSLLDLTFNGYECLSYNPCPTNFQISLPLINVGNIMYIKYPNSDININYYYDSDNRLLNYSTQLESVHCMYKKINDQRYIRYYLFKNNENCILETDIYFLEDGKIVKKEILNSEQLSLNDYNKQLSKFSKYLDKNKICKTKETV